MNEKFNKYYSKATWLQQASLDSIIDLLEDYEKTQMRLQEIRVLLEENPVESVPDLAPREAEAVGYAREGYTLEEIGAKMGTSKNGAADSISRAAMKMGVKNKHKVTAYFLKRIKNVLNSDGPIESVVFPINVPGYGTIGSKKEWNIFLQRVELYPGKMNEQAGNHNG